jgi:putative transposase
MPRRPRLSLPGVTLHLMQRGINGGRCFFDDDDYQTYLDWLQEYAVQTGCTVHAYTLIPTQSYLLVTPPTADAAGQMMKRLGQRYVQHVNRALGRTGTLWEGRFRSCMMQGAEFVLACYRHIELSPVCSGAATHPAEYPWSSYRANAMGQPSPLLTPHADYLALGPDARARLAAYQRSFCDPLDPGLVNEIDRAANGNYVLGPTEFQARIERELHQPATPGKPGRPRRPRAWESLVGMAWGP